MFATPGKVVPTPERKRSITILDGSKPSEIGTAKSTSNNATKQKRGKSRLNRHIWRLTLSLSQVASRKENERLARNLNRRSQRFTYRNTCGETAGRHTRKVMAKQ